MTDTQKKSKTTKTRKSAKSSEPPSSTHQGRTSKRSSQPSRWSRLDLSLWFGDKHGRVHILSPQTATALGKVADALLALGVTQLPIVRTKGHPRESETPLCATASFLGRSFEIDPSVCGRHPETDPYVLSLGDGVGPPTVWVRTPAAQKTSAVAVLAATLPTPRTESRVERVV